ncbi:MAG: hypothetical protein DI570_20800 [Phenylobacterium zucineum]|nr:MAG: hypothetical protein DI570_20800 [Phenylobacterium zucineum]
MRLLHLALIATLLAPGAAAAQSVAQQMLKQAGQLRANVEKLGDKLPAETRAQMLKQAGDLEQSVRNGDFGPLDAPGPPKEQTVAEKILAERGRLDWLMSEPACAGYTQENFDTFRYSQAINDRDAHCRNAHGHWASYLRYSRDPLAAEGASQSLFYYDAAARRAVQHYGR